MNAEQEKQWLEDMKQIHLKHITNISEEEAEKMARHSLELGYALVKELKGK